MALLENLAALSAVAPRPTAHIRAGVTSTAVLSVAAPRPSAHVIVSQGVVVSTVAASIARPSASIVTVNNPSMVGSVTDFMGRIQAVLPTGWFAPPAPDGSPSTTPIADGVLAGFGAAFNTIYNQIVYTNQQGRLQTSTDGFLDLWARDFLGPSIHRRLGETDTAWETRIFWELNDAKATRAAIILRLTTLTGRAPRIMEPPFPSDAGSYANIGSSTSGLAFYGHSPGWYGSLSRPFQIFITAFRPLTVYGIPNLAVLDSEIYTEVANALPANVTGWVAISN